MWKKVTGGPPGNEIQIGPPGNELTFPLLSHHYPAPFPLLDICNRADRAEGQMAEVRNVTEELPLAKENKKAVRRKGKCMISDHYPTGRSFHNPLHMHKKLTGHRNWRWQKKGKRCQYTSGKVWMQVKSCAYVSCEVLPPSRSKENVGFSIQRKDPLGPRLLGFPQYSVSIVKRGILKKTNFWKFMYLRVRERESKRKMMRVLIFWFIAQMPATAKTGLILNQGPDYKNLI